MDKANECCCPEFNPAPWTDKEITWNDKMFVKDHVISFLHIPLNFKQVMIRNVKKIEAVGTLDPQMIVLSDEKSLWGADVYISANKEIQGANMDKISGTFLTKVFEGPYKNCGKWAKEMVDYVKSKGRELKQMYFYYTTCPKCAKKYGKNYVVILAKI